MEITYQDWRRCPPTTMCAKAEELLDSSAFSQDDEYYLEKAKQGKAITLSMEEVYE